MHKWDVRFLRLALEIASWSKDPRTKVGAVIVDAKRTILGLGYNGFPRGVADDADKYADRETKYKYVVHAELNAILSATSDLRGTTMYVAPMPPCNECAKAICQKGVSRVVFAAPDIAPRWWDAFKITRDMFEQCGIVFHRVPIIDLGPHA